MEAAPVVAALMAPLLCLYAAHEALEVEHDLARVAAEGQAQQQPDDARANAARLGVPDVVPVC